MKISELLKIYNSDRFEELYLVLNPIVPSWFITNLDGIILLKELDSVIEIKEDFFPNKELFKKNRILLEHYDFIEHIHTLDIFKLHTYSNVHKHSFLTSLYLNMTPKCNLNCIYCYAAARNENESDPLSYDDYEKIIEDSDLLSNARVNLSFTGGEPLLNPLTCKVANFAQKRGHKCTLMTNGTLITKKNVEELLSIFDQFRISLDGSSKEIHDFFRGKGAYQKTIDAISLLEKNNANFIIAMVVNKKNLENVEEMHNRWKNKLIFQPMFPLSKDMKFNQELEITGEEYFNILSNKAEILPYSSLLNLIQRNKRNESLHKCALGDGELSISFNGDVYPCQLLHQSDFLLGNIHQSSLKEIYNSEKNIHFKNHTVNCISGCRTCDFRFLCGGACQARHFSETGSIDVAGKFCEYEKMSIVDGLISASSPVKIDD